MTTKSLGSTLAAILWAAGLYVVAATAVYVWLPSIAIPFSPAKTVGVQGATGFYAAELTPDHVIFAWTNGHAAVSLNELDRRIPWSLDMKMASGWWPPQMPPPSATVAIDGQRARVLTPGGDFANYEVSIPARPGKRRVVIAFNSPVFVPRGAVPGSTDPRQLGIVINSLSVRPTGLPWPSTGWLAAALATALLLAAACVLVGLGPLRTRILLALLGLLAGLMLRPGSSVFLADPLLPWHTVARAAVLAAVAVIMVKVVALGLPARLRSTFATSVILVTEPLVLLSAVHSSVLALRLPLLSTLPYWRAPAPPKPLGAWYLVAALAAVPFVSWFLIRRLRTRPVLAVSLLVGLGFLFQHGFAWTEGRRLEAMRDRMSKSGHWQFAMVAEQQPSVWQAMVDYEGKLQRDEMGVYPRSKPPGQLLFYMATERVAERLAADPADSEAKLRATATLGAITWPLLSYLVLFPLFFLVRRLAEPETALLACLLYLVVPSVNLIAMHTDQVIFPFLFVTTVWLCAAAQARRSWLLAFVAGIWLYVTGFFTFALLAAVAIGIGSAAAVEGRRAAQSQPPASPALSSILQTIAGIAGGFCLTFFVVAVALDYDFVTRMRESFAFHEAWKAWRGGSREIFTFAWVDYIEFAVWLGMPLTVLTLYSVQHNVRQAAAGRGWEETLAWPALALLAVFVYFGFFGHTKVETARLWLPTVPLCCALAAAELRRRYARMLPTMIAVVLGLQWLTVWLTKAGQDLR